MEDLLQMTVTLLMLVPAAFLAFFGITALVQLKNSYSNDNPRLRRNSLLILGLSFLLLTFLYRLWAWVMWQMD